MAVLPTRPYHPKDKAKVESGVLLAERWILAALRNHSFFSLSELNQAVWEELKELNGRPLQKLGVSRKELFETLDKPAMIPLPAQRYLMAEWKKVRVNLDYHIELEGHYYSVPYQLIHRSLEVRYTATTVEVLHEGKRVASHPRSYEKGAFSTLEAHRPLSHRQYLEWTPERIQHWGKTMGPCTEKLMEEIMASRGYPEQGFRSCLGILRLAKRFSAERLERACQRALALRAYSYKSVHSILQKGLEGLPLLTNQDETKSGGDHENIRGQQYYEGKERRL